MHGGSRLPLSGSSRGNNECGNRLADRAQDVVILLVNGGLDPRVFLANKVDDREKTIPRALTTFKEAVRRSEFHDCHSISRDRIDRALNPGAIDE